MASRSRLSAVLLFTLTLTAALQLPAQEESRELLPASEAGVYLGKWVIRLSSPQGVFDADLEIKESDGQTVAALRLGPLGNYEVDTIFATDDGIELAFEASVGGGTFKMKMPVRRDGDQIAGSLADTGGLFKMDFTGITEARALVLEETGERTRIRIEGGDNPTQRTRLKLGDQEISIRFDKVSVEEADFAQVDSLGEGEVMGFVRHQTNKLRTDVDLHFGDVLVPTHNVAPDYPGVYSLWLRRSADGWELLFNHKADVWGTQHDASADVAAVPLTFSVDASQQETLAFDLQQMDGGGSLDITWGPYRWHTEFSASP